MTAAPGPSQLFSMFYDQGEKWYCRQREAFFLSLLAQALILVLLTLITCCIIDTPPGIRGHIPKLDDFPLIFSGENGGGGGNFEKLPPSHGSLPRASLDDQLVSPNVMRPTAMPKLPVEETIFAAPDVKITHDGQIGDPSSPFSGALSNGPGGPTGMGYNCCGGDGDSAGPYAGSGPPGIYPAGKHGVTVPEVIYNPEPSFSDEARKAKQQGVVVLLVVVGKDGRTSNIRVGQSLGMGLDEKAMEAVSRWLFRPATLNGHPVATQIAIEVDFHLY